MATLLLTGHGASVGSAAAAPILAHADRLRARARFRAVRVAFWKQPPLLSAALDDEDDDVVIVMPLFMSHGYYAQQVVPRELGRAARISGDERRVIYCRAIGAHRAVPRLVEQHAAALIERPTRAALLVVGHGTERDRNSAASTHAAVGWLRRSRRFADVRAAFLDEAPRIADVAPRITAEHLVVVPYLMSEGTHTSADIPRAVAASVPARCRIRYAPAVGTMQELTRLIERTALDALGS